MIHWKLCKRMNFDYTTKWFLHKLECVLVNKKFKILWDFELQKDHLFPDRKPHLLLINKRKDSPVGCGCRIHQLYRCSGVRLVLPTSVLDLILNDLMAMLQPCSVRECEVSLHCHCYQFDSDPDW